jgi:hypothetical protein
VLLKPISRDWRIAVGLVLALTVSFITYEQNQTILLANIEQRIQSLDTGFSEPQSPTTLLANLSEILRGKLLGFSERPALERIDIDIKQLEFEKILADRKRAIETGRLTRPVDVKARIRYQGNSIKAKLRLKGDLPDHWISRYRMSFRVSLKGRNYVLGFKKFSLHKPASRQHPYGQVYSRLIRQSGGLSTVYDYVHVYVNGEDWGIMNIEEHMSKELLEKQQAKDSLILKFGNDERDALFHDPAPGETPYKYYRLSDPRLYIKVYDADEYLVDDIQRKRLSWIARQRLQPENTTLYDVDGYSRALLLAFAWNDGHPLHRANLKHYFNPYLLQLEPIPSDSFVPFPIGHYGLFPRALFDPLLNNTIYPEVFASDKYRQHLGANLARVRQAIDYTGRSTTHYQRYFPLDKKIDIATILKNNEQLLTRPEAPALQPAAHGDDTHSLLYLNHYTNGRIRIYNRVPGPVTIDGLYLDGRLVSRKPLQIPAYDPYAPSPVVMNTGLQGDLSGRLSVTALYRGRQQRIPFANSASALQPMTLPRPDTSATLPPVSPAQAALLPAHLHIRQFENGRFELFNLLPEPVTLESIQVHGDTRLRPGLRIPGYRPGDYSPVILSTDIKGIQDGNITITTSFKGERRTTNVGPTLMTSGLDNPLLAATPPGLPWLRKSAANTWQIPAGDWQIDRSLTVQGDLEIQAGAHLSFAGDAFLIVRGSLRANGTAANPISLGPRDDDWPGVYVVRGLQRSRLSHVTFKNTRALESGLLRLSGGVSFYASDVSLESVLFDGSQAEDALNLIKSNFSIIDVQVRNTASDGIDFDFSNGLIRHSSFSAIGGDALDFSGSKVRIDNVDARHIQDKAVSAGEESTISITDSVIENTRIGLAAKDGSQISGRGIRIRDYTLKAAMSYVKKGFYRKAPEIHLVDSTVSAPERAYSRQRGTTLSVDGVAISAETIDVERLYGQDDTTP